MGKISNEEFDRLFKNKLSGFDEVPSDNSANRIFDSIVDHSYSDKPASRRSLFVLPRFPKTATRYVAVALASAAASVFITLSIIGLDQSQSGPVAQNSHTALGTSSSTAAKNSIEKQGQQTDETAQVGNKIGTRPVKETISTSNQNTPSSLIAKSETNIPNHAISTQKDQGGTPIQAVSGTHSNEHIGIAPPMNTGKSLQDTPNNNNAESIFAIEADSEISDENNETQISLNTIRGAETKQITESSPTDSAQIEPPEIAEATLAEEEVLQNLPFLEKSKAAPEKVKIQTYASIDAGYFSMDVTKVASEEPYNGMRTNSFNYALQYKNACISIGAGYAELQTAQNYEIAYRQVDYNVYDDYLPSMQEASTENLNTEKKTMSFVSEKTATQQTKLSNSYITLPISASYLLRKNKFQTGIKGSIVFIYLINSEETAADFSEYTHIQSTESMRDISPNTVSFEISIPFYYEIWKNTQIFTEIAGQAYTQQFISADSPANHRLLSAGAKAGLQFKL